MELHVLVKHVLIFTVSCFRAPYVSFANQQSMRTRSRSSLKERTGSLRPCPFDALEQLNRLGGPVVPGDGWIFRVSFSRTPEPSQAKEGKAGTTIRNKQLGTAGQLGTVLCITLAYLLLKQQKHRQSRSGQLGLAFRWPSALAPQSESQIRSRHDGPYWTKPTSCTSDQSRPKPKGGTTPIFKYVFDNCFYRADSQGTNGGGISRLLRFANPRGYQPGTLDKPQYFLGIACYPHRRSNPMATTTGGSRRNPGSTRYTRRNT